jgi:hypothetical protein
VSQLAGVCIDLPRRVVVALLASACLDMAARRAAACGGGPLAGAAVWSGRIMRRRDAAQDFAGCLTTTCTGAADVRFTWLQVRPFGGPVMWSVMPRNRSRPLADYAGFVSGCVMDGVAAH